MRHTRNLLTIRALVDPRPYSAPVSTFSAQCYRPRVSVENHKSRRRREVLDGHKSWSNAAARDDHDRFFSMYVIPLRQLRDEGLFESLKEVSAAINREQIIVAVEIEGSINFR